MVVELDGAVLCGVVLGAVVVVVVVVCCVWSPVVVVWLPVVDVPVVDVWLPEGAVVVVVLWVVSCANRATEQANVRTSRNAIFFMFAESPVVNPGASGQAQPCQVGTA